MTIRYSEAARIAFKNKKGLRPLNWTESAKTLSTRATLEGIANDTIILGTFKYNDAIKSITVVTQAADATFQGALGLCAINKNGTLEPITDEVLTMFADAGAISSVSKKIGFIGGVLCTLYETAYGVADAVGRIKLNKIYNGKFSNINDIECALVLTITRAATTPATQLFIDVEYIRGAPSSSPADHVALTPITDAEKLSSWSDYRLVQAGGLAISEVGSGLTLEEGVLDFDDEIITSGDGIEVSTDSETGKLTIGANIVAGDGIAKTVTDGEMSLSANIVAGAGIAKTVTNGEITIATKLVAGANITLTPNAETGEIVIAYSA